MHIIGIIFAFLAFVTWGFGEFFAQKVIRHVGSWIALFFDCCFVLFGLLFFVWKDLFILTMGDFVLLTLTSIVVAGASLLDFQALKEGKICIVEPIIGLEIPLTAAFSITLGGESISMVQIILILVVFIGIILAITEHHEKLHYHKRIFEKGVTLALVAAICMALNNLLVGVSSREISPLMTIWFTDSFVAVICAIYIIYTKNYKNIFLKFRNHIKIIFGHSFFDNAGWIAFAYSTLFIPISITTTISEGYIALAAFLGLVISREKIKRHQFIGVVFAMIGVIALAYFSE